MGSVLPSTISSMIGAIQNIDALSAVEDDLNKQSPSIERSAKKNLLKYLQVNAVMQYARIFDELYFNLKQSQGFLELAAVKGQAGNNGRVMQLMEMGSIEKYLEQAETARVPLGELITFITRGTPGLEGITASVKSLKSATRKANKAEGGIRCVTDLARATVVCDTPHDLATVFKLLKSTVAEVRNFNNAAHATRFPLWDIR